METSAQRFPDKIALVYGQQRLTYAQLEAQCNCLAHSLVAEGVQRGDRVAVCLSNSVEAVVAIFAILKAGAVFVPLNPTTKADKLVYILTNCQACALFTASEKLSELRESWSKLPNLKTVCLVGAAVPPKEDSPRFVDFNAMSRDANAGNKPPEKKCIDIDLAALIYTSGSTGRPKGVMLTHLNLTSATTSITTYLENTAEDVILNPLPLSYGYGLTQIFTAFKAGATVVLHRSFTYPFALIETLISEKITGIPVVPTIAANLLQMDLSKYEFPALRYITNAAAAMPAAHLMRLRQVFPNTRIYLMYGLTECIRVTYLPPEQISIRPASVGRGMPNQEVYLVDENGERVPPGVVGQLVVRGSNVMKGYWEMPEETARALGPGPLNGEKVLYSGDLFRMDDEGYLYFVARKDDIIKCRGEKVSPKEVEDVLYKLEGITEAAVIGLPDPMLGQVIKAFVVLREGSELTQAQILRHCAAHLEDFMVPRFLEFREALPKSDNGKIHKLTLLSGAVEAS